MTVPIDVSHAPPVASNKLGIVLTGGTISTVPTGTGLSLSDRRARALVPTGDVIVAAPITRLSEDIQPADWILIAEAVHSLWLDGASGVVILHGTDTMTYTSAALSFLLASLPIPVVLTGSNRPVDDPHSDAATNVGDAVVAARGLPAGTYISFAGTAGVPSDVLLGTTARKRQAGGRAFVSEGRPPVAEVRHGELRLLVPPVPPAAPTPPVITPRLAVDEHVLALRLYPGCPLDALGQMAQSSMYRGVVVELYASATGPSGPPERSLARFTESCTRSGVVVVGVVSAGLPEVSGLYESTRAFTDAGGLLLDLLPETATAKLMWASAQATDAAAVRDLMLSPIAAG